MLLTDVAFGEAEARQVYSVITWRTHHAPDHSAGVAVPCLARLRALHGSSSRALKVPALTNRRR